MSDDRRGPLVLGLTRPPYQPSTAWRVVWPLRHLHQAGYRTSWLVVSGTDGAWLERAARADIVVINKGVWPATRHEDVRVGFAYWRACGCAVVADYDDDAFSADLASVHAESEAAAGARLFGDLPPLSDRVALLREFDAITVGTEALAARVRALTDRPVYVVPCLIPLDWWRRVAAPGERPPAGPVHVGWAGGAHPAGDLEAMVEGWRRVAARSPREAVRFVVVGQWQAPFDRGFPPGLAPRHWGMYPLERYPAGLAGIDIGCAAVRPREIVGGKSPIKCLEYGAAGAAVVATPTLYGEVVRDGETGLLATTPEQWESALVALIEDAGLRHRLAAQLTTDVERDWSLENQAHRWVEVWERIVADFAASGAQQAAAAALPELAAKYGDGTGATPEPPRPAVSAAMAAHLATLPPLPPLNPPAGAATAEVGR